MKSETTYEAAGVNTDRAENALSGLLALIESTNKLRKAPGTLELDIGFFANVVNIGKGQGIAISTDGVGSKLLLAQEMDRYDTIGIDCVAMNVNDVLCVGADPVSLVDYIAVRDPDPHYIGLLGQGLVEGCRRANINISGGEIAQLRDVLHGVEGKFAFDLVGTCIGIVDTDRVIVGAGLVGGETIIGMRSSGVHSNGLTLIRQVLFKDGGLGIGTSPSELGGRSIGEELLEPTHIYAQEVRALLNAGVDVKGLANITSDGILNLSRLQADVDYRIDRLPEAQPIFRMVQECGAVSDAEMYQTFNMGIGFCVIVPGPEAERALKIIEDAGVEGFVIGVVEPNGSRRVRIPALGLVGSGHHFEAS